MCLSFLRTGAVEEATNEAKRGPPARTLIYCPPLVGFRECCLGLILEDFFACIAAIKNFDPFGKLHAWARDRQAGSGVRSISLSTGGFNHSLDFEIDQNRKNFAGGVRSISLWPGGHGL